MTRTLIAALLIAALAASGCTEDHGHQTAIVIDFPEGRADIEAQVKGLERLALGATGGPAHPDGYTAHDQLLAWSQQSGVPVEVRAFSFGYCLNAIDAVPSPGSCESGATAYWALSVNGEASMSGMGDVVLAKHDVVTWTYTPLGSEPGTSTEDVGLTVQPPMPTRGDRITLNGTLGRAATLSIGSDSRELAAGDWTFELPLEPGQTPVRIVADDGRATQAIDLVLVRLAPATLSAEFTSALPPRAAIADTIWFDIDALLAAPLHDGKGIPHPPHATVHDALVAWTQAGRAVEVSYHESFAFGVESIDGHGALSDWCYTVNGENAELGITGQRFEPGDVIHWSGCLGA